MNRSRQLAFVEDFAQWLDDGYSPARACQALLQHARAQRLQREQKLLGHIMQTLNQGKPLVQALKHHLDKDLCMMFGVGERAGCLHRLLQEFQQSEQQRRSAQSQFIKPLLYPFAVSLLALAASYFVGQKVLPGLAGAVPMADWPALSQWLLVIGQPLMVLALLLLLSTVMLLVWGPHWLPGQGHPLGQWLARHGCFRIARGFAAVTLLQSLALLLRNGYNLDAAAQLLLPQVPTWLREHLQLLRQRLLRGERKLERLLDTGLLSPRMLFRLSNSGQSQHEGQDADHLTMAAARSVQDAQLALLWTRLLLQGFLYLFICALMLLVLGGTGALLMTVSGELM